ncbi:MAG TPA: hypothetical protein VFT96_08070, partial [Gemmatimonadaceae bacterium]|nr:hypothetical protein [Gemmatimonadaceae bacterium]
MIFRPLRLASLATLVLLAASCDGPTGNRPSGPITTLDGLVTFEPDHDVSTPRAVLRPASVPSPNDTRPIPGSMFFFDPGPVGREVPGGNVGTLIVRYDRLALATGIDPTTLRLTFRSDGEWVSWSDSWIDTETKTLRVRAMEGGATYAVLSPVGMAISVALGEHYPGYHSGDSLLVHAWVHSDEELASVTARYADREVELPVEHATWRGWLQVAGVPAGAHVLRATARTTAGREISDTITITRNIPPVVSVTSPLAFTVANPMLRLQATCSDDAAGGCRSLTASVRYPDGVWVQVASGTARIDADVSLSGWVGQLELAITGTDVVGQAVTRTHTVYALDAANVSARVRTAGPVLDFDGTRVLYADSVIEKTGGGYLATAGSGRIRFGTGDATADQVLHRGGLPDWGTILAPDHALFTIWRHRLIWRPLDWTLTYPDADSVYEWRGGATMLLSAESHTRQLPVDGGITAWQDGVRKYDSQPKVTTIRMRDLASGSTSTLST